MTARPTGRGVVVVDLGPEADPEALTPAVLDQERSRLGCRRLDDGTWKLSWKFRKEYLRDFDAQTGMPVFEPEWLDAQAKNMRNPLYCLDIDESGNLVKRERGRVRVWAESDAQPAELPSNAVKVTRAVAIGIDVGEGVQASETTMMGMFADTREQCMEFNSSRITPNDMGRLAVKVAKHFNDALIVCVRKMHGLTVLRTMRDEHYPYIWHSRIESGMVSRPTEQLGWGGGEMSDERLVDPLRDALQYGRITIRSSLLHRQFSEYIFDEQGQIVHQTLAAATIQERERHGDIVVGCALALKGCFDLPKFRAVQQRAMTPIQKHLAQKQAAKTSVWS